MDVTRAVMAGVQIDGEGTPVQSVEVEAPQVTAVKSTVTPEQWAAMHNILSTVYAYRKPEYAWMVVCTNRIVS